MKHAQQSFTTVNSPNPPTKKVQVAQVSDASAESAPFIYFDGVLTAGVPRAMFASNSAPAAPFRRRMARRKRFTS
jgi:hypothetical protein